MWSRGRKPVWSLGCAVLLLAGCVAAPPKGDLQRGFSVWGYVGRGPTAPAPMVPVALLDANSGTPVASDQTDFMGKYGFSGLAPGSYAVRAEKVTRVKGTLLRSCETGRGRRGVRVCREAPERIANGF